MKQALLAFIAFLGLTQTTSAQSILAQQGFEGIPAQDNWNYTVTPSSYYLPDSSDIWSIADTVGTGSATARPFGGRKLWAMRDLNNSTSGGNVVHTMTLASINTTGFSNMQLILPYYVDGSPAGNGYDTGDSIHYRLNLNGATGTRTALVRGGTGGSGRTTGWDTLVLTIPNGTTSVSLDLLARQDGNADWAAFDQIRLVGTAGSCPGDSMSTAIDLGTLGSPWASVNGNNSSGTCFTNTFGQPSPDVWYKITVPACMDSLKVRVCSPDTNFVLRAQLLNSSGTAVGMDGTGMLASCGGTFANYWYVDNPPAGVYYIVVEGLGNSVGQFEVSTEGNSISAPSITYGSNSVCATGTLSASMMGGSQTRYYSTPSGLALDSITAAIDLSASAAGNYVVQAINCAGTSNFALTVTTNASATIAYPSASYCLNNLPASIVPTIQGTTGGTFSTTSGLSVDASTGALSPTANQTASYVITYQTGGACGATARDTVEFVATPATSIAYLGSPYCLNAASAPMATILGATGGTFSSASSALALDANTGAINLASSSAGTYTVTYQIAGQCPVSTNSTVELLVADSAAFAIDSFEMMEADTMLFARCQGLSTVSILGTTGGRFYLSVYTPSRLGSIQTTIDSITGTLEHIDNDYTTYAVDYITRGTCPDTARLFVRGTSCESVTTLQNVRNLYTLYPNPSTGAVWVETQQTHDEAQIQVLDLLGRVVWSGMYNQLPAAPLPLPLTDLANGIYTVRLMTTTQQQIEKLVIQRP